jgi:hypothetical protein
MKKTTITKNTNRINEKRKGRNRQQETRRKTPDAVAVAQDQRMSRYETLKLILK